MHSKILVVVIAFAASALAGAQWTHDLSAHPVAPIPSSGTGGAANGCANPANKTVVTMASSECVRIQNVDAWLLFNHSYAHDLRISISHGGTTVVLFNQYPGTGGHSFNGYYNFRDSAPSGISAAIIPNQVPLQSGLYQPASPLSVFDGMSGAGPWTMEVCDLAAIDTGTLTDCGVSFESGTFYDQSFPQIQPIPQGSGGGCTNPLTYVFSVPPGNGPVCRIEVGCSMWHQYANELTMTLMHGGVLVNLCTDSLSPQFPHPQLNGDYLFADNAPTTWAFWMGVTGVVASGSYRPESPLSAFNGVESGGPWFLTICDAWNNGATGAISATHFHVDVTGYRFDITQPAGSSSITLTNSGGIPGNLYLNAFTLTPGTFPFGWLNGLDIPVAELVNQINLGVPFFGALDQEGGATTTIPGPIPYLTAQYVSFDFGPNGVPVASIPAAILTTAP